MTRRLTRWQLADRLRARLARAMLAHIDRLTPLQAIQVLDGLRAEIETLAYRGDTERLRERLKEKMR